MSITESDLNTLMNTQHVLAQVLALEEHIYLTQKSINSVISYRLTQAERDELQDQFSTMQITSEHVSDFFRNKELKLYTDMIEEVNESHLKRLQYLKMT